MASFSLEGKLIEKFNTQEISATFKKREFVIEHARDINGTIYSDFIKMQLTQDKVDLLNDLQLGANIKVTFNIRGSKYNKKDGSGLGYITNLDAWRIELMGAASASPSNASPNISTAQTTEDIVSQNAEDDLPF